MISPDEMHCPACHKKLAIEDVNVSKDFFLCRNCKKTGRFSEIIDESQDEKILDSVPSRIKISETLDGLVINYRKPKGAGIFLLFFALFWNGIVYGVMISSLKQKTGNTTKIFETFEILFLIPFVLVGLVVLVAALYILIGNLRIILSYGQGRFYRGICGMGFSRSFRLARNAGIRVEASLSGKNGKTPAMIVVEQPEDKPFKFGIEIAEGPDQQFIAALLRKMRD